jgi:hypothetical protein
MLWTRNLFIAIAISTMLSGLLSFLPRITTNQEWGLTPVFKTITPMAMNRDNIVDLLSSMPLHHPITHVQWVNNNLTLDFEIGVEKPIYVDDIYEDLFTSLRSVFLQTNNVQGLYVRFTYVQNGKSEVLIAFSTEKSGEILNTMQSIRDVDQMKDFLKGHTQLYYGVLWKEKIENPS